MSPDRTQFIEQLKRRKIVQWTIAYLSAAWLSLQVVDVIGEQFDWPQALERGITATLGAGLLVTLVISWFHGEKGQQRVTRLEIIALSFVLVVSGFMVRSIAGGGRAADPAAPRSAPVLAAGPNAIVVAPFAATSPDSALDRLGRDLSFTVAAALDGIEALQTVDPQTVLARSGPDERALSLASAIALAHEFGAGRVLHGGLTRAGAQVRLDATLYEATSARAVARVTALDHPSRIGALTDSVTLSLARQLWRGATPHVPSAAALATSSVAALRAYLDGEHALARGDMPQATASFERAYALDTAYIFAYWRSLYPRTYEGTRPDSAAVERLIQGRHTLPPVDGMLVEVALSQTLSGQRALLETTVQRFPTHWPAWFTYANLLVHHGPYLGSTTEDARVALERVIQLNPDFAPAWEHLLWIVGMERDSAAIEATNAQLESFTQPDGYRFNEDRLLRYRTLADALHNGDSLPPERIESTVDYMLAYRGPVPQQFFGIDLVASGFPRTQMKLNEAVLRAAPSALLAEGMWHGLALAAATRGAWDSAAATADRWALSNGTFGGVVAAYGLVTTGAALGFMGSDAALQRRPRLIPEDAPLEVRAEMAWLDGVLAWAQRDRQRLARARRELTDTGSRFLPLLDATLDALELNMQGAHEQAARRIVAAEDSAADRFMQMRYGHAHPYVSTVNRLLAAQWLLDQGQPAEAARLLTFVDAVIPGASPLGIVNATVGSTGTYYRARAAEALGRDREARTHYTRFIQQFDMSDPALQPLLDDARGRLARMGRG